MTVSQADLVSFRNEIQKFVKDEIKNNNIMSEYKTALKINNHIADTTTKTIAVTSGLAIAGVALIPVPVIGPMLGLGISIGATVGGFMNVIINESGSIEIKGDLKIGALMDANPGLSYEKAKEEQEWLNEWFEKNPGPFSCDEHQEKEELKQWRETIPRNHNGINLKPLLPFK